MPSPNFRAIARALADLASRKGNNPETVPYAQVEKMLGRKLTKDERATLRTAWATEVDRIMFATIVNPSERRKYARGKKR